MKVSPELKAAVYRVIGEAGKIGISSADIYNKCPDAEKPADVAHAIKALQEDGLLHHRMSQPGEGKKKYLVKLYIAKVDKPVNAPADAAADQIDTIWSQAAERAAGETNNIVQAAVNQVLDSHAAIEDRAQAVGVRLDVPFNPYPCPAAYEQEIGELKERVEFQAGLLKRYEERAAEQDITIGQLKQDLAHANNLVESYQEGSATINDANKRLAAENQELRDQLQTANIRAEAINEGDADLISDLRGQLAETNRKLEAERQAHLQTVQRDGELIQDADAAISGLRSQVETLQRELDLANRSLEESTDPLGHFRPMFDLAAAAGLNYHAGRVVEAICAGAYPLAMNILADLMQKQPPVAPEQIPQE